MQSLDNLCANAIRVVSADAIQRANSGHPGMVMGAAPMGYALYSKHMIIDPKHPDWQNRDRFVLSAGHGSMLLYSLLHMFGFGLTMEDLKSFRQWNSPTAGHPEYGHAAGIEATTGPLGQGVCMAVGMAMAEAHLAAKFNKEGFPVVDHYTYALVGDGCLQEGISSEAPLPVRKSWISSLFCTIATASPSRATPPLPSTKMSRRGIVPMAGIPSTM